MTSTSPVVASSAAVTDLEPPSSDRWSLRAVVLAAILFASLLAFMPMRLAVYAHDELIQLEGAWRLEQGMRIHDAMHTPMGALYPLLLQLGLKIFGPMPQAFLIPALIPLPFVVWASWLILRPRFGPRTTALLTILLIAILVGPTCLGDPVDFGRNWQRTTFGMQYNRVFWPFAALLPILCLVPPRSLLSDRSARNEAILAGVLLALGFFGKVNLFVAGLPILAVGTWRQGWDRAYGLRVGGGFVGVTTAFLLLGVPLIAYLGDIRDLSRAQSMLDRVQQFGLVALVNLEYVLAILAAGLVLWRASRAWLPAASILMLLYGVLVTSANYQERLIPPLMIALFVLAEHTRRSRDTAPETSRVAQTVTTAVGVGWIALTLISFIPPYLDYFTKSSPSITDTSYSPFFQASIVHQGDPAARVIHSLDKQAAECDRLFGPKARVFRMGWYNVLPVLRRAPSPYGLLWYHSGRTVNRETLPRPERELRDVDAVVWPKVLETPDLLIAESYQTYIAQYFVPLHSDDTATYYRRR